MPQNLQHFTELVNIHALSQNGYGVLLLCQCVVGIHEQVKWAEPPAVYEGREATNGEGGKEEEGWDISVLDIGEGHGSFQKKEKKEEGEPRHTK